MDRSGLEIIGQHLRSTPIKEVYFASGLTNPPVLAYLVNFARLAIPLGGCYEVEFERNGHTQTVGLGPGQAIFAPPNCWDKPTWRLAANVVFFLFGKRQTGISFVRSQGDNQITADKISIPQPLGGAAYKILDSILELNGNEARFPAYPQLIESLAYSCISFFENNSSSHRKNKPFCLFQNMCDYLQQNFQVEVTRNVVSGQFGITPNHLSRLFKTQGNMRFSEYLQFVRVDRAKLMLCKYDMSLDEIAQRCGFSDTPYFCRIFKKITKKTPSLYREYIRARNPA